MWRRLGEPTLNSCFESATSTSGTEAGCGLGWATVTGRPCSNWAKCLHFRVHHRAKSWACAQESRDSIDSQKQPKAELHVGDAAKPTLLFTCQQLVQLASRLLHLHVVVLLLFISSSFASTCCLPLAPSFGIRRRQAGSLLPPLSCFSAAHHLRGRSYLLRVHHMNSQATLCHCRLHHCTAHSLTFS